MNQLNLINQNGKLYADSREVALMIGKDHDQLMRSIRTYVKYLESAKLQSQEFFVSSTYVNSQNKQQPCFLITKKGCDMVANKMTGEKGVLFTAAYVTKFEEMEQALNQPSYMITNPIDRAKKWIEEQEHTQRLETKIQVDAPKVALYDTAMSAKNNQTMGAVAKSLGVGRNKLFQFLRDKKVLLPNNQPYQRYIDQGYFDVRQYTITHLTQGLENKTQTMVTPKGMAYIHKLLTKESSRGEAYEHHDIPIKLSEALYLAAQIARRNEEMEAELTELRMNNQYPEVLQSKHILELLGIGKSTLSEWAQDPTFPHLQGDWEKGKAIRVRKSEFYAWLKDRKEREVDRHFNVRRIGRKAI